MSERKRVRLPIMKIKAAKVKLTAIIVILSIVIIMIYHTQFRSINNDDIPAISNDDILAYGWKGGNCDSLPDVLDFRNGRLTLHNDELYFDGQLLGRIVKREYRSYDDGYIKVLTVTGELCPFWAKWKN